MESIYTSEIFLREGSGEVRCYFTQATSLAGFVTGEYPALRVVFYAEISEVAGEFFGVGSSFYKLE